MKRKIAALAVLLVLAAAGYAFAQGGMMGGQKAPAEGQGHGQGMMGGGMMGQGGMGQGGGMMGGQGGMGGMMGMMRMMQECGRMMEVASPAEPVTKERAEEIVKQNLANLRNPNVKTGKVTEETAGFIVEVTTKDGALVDKIAVDKRTGYARSVY